MARIPFYHEFPMPDDDDEPADDQFDLPDSEPVIDGLPLSAFEVFRPLWGYRTFAFIDRIRAAHRFQFVNQFSQE